MDRLVEVRREGAVDHVTLNRPDVRNALNAEVIDELARWAAGVRTDRGVRAAVLSGAGKVFSAGADIDWMHQVRGYTEQENVDDARRIADLFEKLDTVPVPLIGRVHGAAIGGGSGLAAVCDVVVAAEDAVFGFTEVRLGILPAVISPYVVRKIGLSATRELFLTGARFPAEKALRVGLVHAVVPAASLDRTVAQYVADVLAGGPTAIAATKALIPRVAFASPRDVAGLTSAAIATQRVSAEGQEGLAAFLEKRAPAWAGPSA